MGVRADVYQLVAVHLGQSRTTGPGASDKTTQRLDAIYDHEARKFLESYPWNFAASLTQLTASEPTPDDWDYGFAKPGLCRRIIRVDSQAEMDGREDIPYDIRKNRILTNSATTWLYWVDGAYADSEGAWPAHALDAFALECAVKIAPTFDMSATDKDNMKRDARREMRKAKLFDAQQKKVYRPPPSQWQQQRLTNVSGKNG